MKKLMFCLAAIVAIVIFIDVFNIACANISADISAAGRDDRYRLLQYDESHWKAQCYFKGRLIRFWRDISTLDSRSTAESQITSHKSFAEHFKAKDAALKKHPKVVIP